MAWSRKDIFGIEGLNKEELFTILKVGKYYKDSMKSKPVKSFKILKGYTIINMFFEASTRTRISFEVAEKRMGASTINFNVALSSVKKGETFVDTIKTINAMHIDAMVIRHFDRGIPQLAKQYFDGSVLNAGDGTHEHPTQTYPLFTLPYRPFRQTDRIKRRKTTLKMCLHFYYVSVNTQNR